MNRRDALFFFFFFHALFSGLRTINKMNLKSNAIYTTIVASEGVNYVYCGEYVIIIKINCDGL